MPEMTGVILRSGLRRARPSSSIPHREFISRAARVAEIERVFNGRERRLKVYIQALRLHQWLKNLLVFVPLVMAHRFLELDLLGKDLSGLFGLWALCLQRLSHQ